MIKHCLLFLLSCNIALAGEVADRHYTVRFSADFKPEQGTVQAHVDVIQSAHLLRLLDLNAAEPEFTGVTADGAVERDGNRVLWSVPASGGRLSYEVSVDHQRNGFLDAHMAKDWAVLRLDDLFPSARVRSRVGAVSQSFLELEGPPGWHFESRYREIDGTISIDDPDRRFDRPTGWLAAGKLGIRRDMIAHRRVAIAAPRGQGMRRMDINAFLRWTLPELIRVFPDFPDRLLIVGARDEMWRGGLSGPGSIYLHAERPLVSENATSTLLHELVHTATGRKLPVSEDWIKEGLAEYYSLEILRRSGGISEKRHDKSLQQLAAWAKRENSMLTTPSSGANTARAVLVFDMIQRELAGHKAGSLDDIVRQLLGSQSVDRNTLLQLVESALAGRSESLRKALELDLN